MRHHCTYKIKVRLNSFQRKKHFQHSRYTRPFLLVHLNLFTLDYRYQQLQDDCAAGSNAAPQPPEPAAFLDAFPASSLALSLKYLN